MSSSNGNDRAGRGTWKNEGETTYKERFGEADWERYSAEEFPIPMPAFSAWTKAELIAKSMAVGGSVGGAIPLTTRQRPTHKRGVGAAGTIKIVDNPGFPEHEFFAAGRVFLARARHATLRFTDDAALDGRSAALKFADTDGDAPLTIHMNSGGALFTNVNTVFDFNLATTLNQLERYLHKHPSAWVQWVDTVRRNPESFARCSFNGVHVYGFNTADGRKLYCKYRQVPWDNWQSIADDSGLPDREDQTRMWIGDRLPGDPRPTDYLRAEYKARMAREGAIRHRLQIQVRAFDPTRDTQEFFNGAKTWDTPWLELAEVTMTRVLDDEVADRSKWDIGNRPPSLPIVEAFSNDDYNGICWTRARWYGRSAKLRQAFGLHHVDAVASGTTYHIVIQADAPSDMGTFGEATIGIMLSGKNGDSDRFALTVRAADLAQHRIVEYAVVFRDLGELRSLTLDGGAALASFQVHELAVVATTDAGTSRWQFPCEPGPKDRITLHAAPREISPGDSPQGCPFHHADLRRTLMVNVQSARLADASADAKGLFCVLLCASSGFSAETPRSDTGKWDAPVSFELASESEPLRIELRSASGSVGSVEINVEALPTDGYFTRNYALSGGGSLLVQTRSGAPRIATGAPERVPQSGGARTDAEERYLARRRRIYDFARAFPEKDVTIDSRYRDSVGRAAYPLLPPFVADFGLAVTEDQIWSLDTVRALADNGIKSTLDRLLNDTISLTDRAEARAHAFLARLGLVSDTEKTFGSLEVFTSYLREKYSEYFFEFVGEPTAILEHWIADDEEFGRQRVGGVNAMELQKYRGSEADLRALGTGAEDVLVPALAGGNLFWCDYSDWMGCVTNLQRGKFGIGDGAHAFFVLEREQQRLMPKAIRLERSGPWFYPSHGFAWLFAKMYINSCDAQDQGTRLHLFYTHLLHETISVAMQRSFGERHPLRVLLTPHLVHTMSIDELSRKTMFVPGGLVDNANAGGRIASYMQIDNALRKLRFMDLALPSDLQRRGVDTDDLPIPFPYRDDAKDMWEAVAFLSTSFVAAFYPSDAAVADDPELHAFVSAVAGQLNQGGRESVDVFDPDLTLKGSADRFPTAVTTRDELSAMLTNIIFGASFQHAAVNNPQFDFFGFIPNCFTSMNGPPPRALDVQPDQILSALGTMQQSLYQMAFIFEMTTVNKETILHDPGDADYVQRCYGFKSAAGRQVIAAYHKRLVEARDRMIARGEARKADFFARHPGAKVAPFSVVYGYLDPCKVDLTIQV